MRGNDELNGRRARKIRLTLRKATCKLRLHFGVQSSSMVEQSAVNRWVAGSSPASGAISDHSDQGADVNERPAAIAVNAGPSSSVAKPPNNPTPATTARSNSHFGPTPWRPAGANSRTLAESSVRALTDRAGRGLLTRIWTAADWNRAAPKRRPGNQTNDYVCSQFGKTNRCSSRDAHCQFARTFAH